MTIDDPTKVWLHGRFNSDALFRLGARARFDSEDAPECPFEWGDFEYGFWMAGWNWADKVANGEATE